MVHLLIGVCIVNSAYVILPRSFGFMADSGTNEVASVVDAINRPIFILFMTFYIIS